jgi:PPK2 family polyphosphate:nucleotide phosphotransferase
MHNRPELDLAAFTRPFVVPAGHAVVLARDHDPGDTADLVNKRSAAGILAEGIRELAEFQAKLYAQNEHALLIILQALDAGGKDGIIKHVMSGLNPQGCQVYSFKVPSAEELDHDYLWRFFTRLPERGRIGLFNRSYYEDVLVVRVHPELVVRSQLPDAIPVDGSLWQQRFRQINAFERYLVENGIVVLKFFLNLGKDEQRKRFLDRIKQPDKNWKFSERDVAERAFWDDYQRAYEDCLSHTSTDWAPWHVIPADHKWFARLAVAAVITQAMRSLAPDYPTPTDEHLAALERSRQLLEAEA